MIKFAQGLIWISEHIATGSEVKSEPKDVLLTQPKEAGGAMRFLTVTIAGCVLLLAVDTTPGMFGSCLLCPCFSMMLLGAAAVGWAVRGLRAVSASDAPRRQRLLAYLAGGVVVVSAVLWLANVPKRVALWAVQGEFEALLAVAPQGYGGEQLDRWLGCFHIDAYGADAEGGVFFRTASHVSGLGPDMVSYGFAYRPHKESCPFGRAGYRAERLFGDWYWFSVSDD